MTELKLLSTQSAISSTVELGVERKPIRGLYQSSTIKVRETRESTITACGTIPYSFFIILISLCLRFTDENSVAYIFTGSVWFAYDVGITGHKGTVAAIQIVSCLAAQICEQLGHLLEEHAA